MLKLPPALPEAAPATCSHTASKHRASSPSLEPLRAAMLRKPVPGLWNQLPLLLPRQAVVPPSQLKFHLARSSLGILTLRA